VGKIFEAYRDGLRIDDGDVALLHADADHGFRPFTVPLVNVRPALEAAAKRGLLDGDEVARIEAIAEGVFYQDRTWARVLAQTGLEPKRRLRLSAWLERSAPDLKREDARRCLKLVRAWLRGGAVPPRPKIPPRLPSTSNARRRRLQEGRSQSPRGERVPNSELLARLWQRQDSGALADAGLRRALIVGLARNAGWTVSDSEREAARVAWFESLGVSDDQRGAFLDACGLDREGERQLVEALALERKALTHASRLLTDGPDASEGLTLEARISGLWADAVRSWRPARAPRAKAKRRGAR
jgi:hypothetical protein